MTLKIAVFAPMPSARVRTAMKVKPGVFRSWRSAKRRSFMAPSDLSHGYFGRRFQIHVARHRRFQLRADRSSRGAAEDFAVDVIETEPATAGFDLRVAAKIPHHDRAAGSARLERARAIDRVDPSTARIDLER